MQFTVYKVCVKDKTGWISQHEATIATIEGGCILTIRRGAPSGGDLVRGLDTVSTHGAAAYDAAVAAMAKVGFTAHRELAEFYAQSVTLAYNSGLKEQSGSPQCSFADLANAYINEDESDYDIAVKRIVENLTAAFNVLFSDKARERLNEHHA